MADATISAPQARRLFLGATGLLDDPTRRATAPGLLALIEQLGFVQVDSINVVERAHHLILHIRLDEYGPELLRELLEEQRSLFEHWTHDASIVPTRWFAQWKPRFSRDRKRMKESAWWTRQLGGDAARVVASVRARIAKEGPLRSEDFEHAQKRGAWWDWKPQKAALDFLWRSGELMIPRRERFAKLYDLTERVLPDHHALAAPTAAAHREWACRTAAERLAIFTPRELAQFWNAIDVKDAQAECARAIKLGLLDRVQVAHADGSVAAALAVADWEERLQKLPAPVERMRLLCPFDPLLRDRARALRRFGFDYRFEAFVPAAKRQHGYFVMPILEGEKLVGRLDPKLHRASGVLEIRGLWWEPGLRETKARRRALQEELARFATFLGATRIDGI